jgi:hypothetical protein
VDDKDGLNEDQHVPVSQPAAPVEEPAEEPEPRKPSAGSGKDKD